MIISTDKEKEAAIALINCMVALGTCINAQGRMNDRWFDDVFDAAELLGISLDDLKKMLVLIRRTKNGTENLLGK